MTKRIVSVDIGLKGGISIFLINEGSKAELINIESMPIKKIEVKQAKYVLDLKNGKKQYYKTGPNKGEVKKKLSSPAKYKEELDLFKIKSIFSSSSLNVESTIVFESPGTSFGNAAGATATTNRNFGKLLAIAELSKSNIVEVPAQLWKKDLSLTKDKLQCVDYAEKLFNKCFKTKNGALIDGEAESALIGHWYITKKLGKNYCYL